MKALPVSFGRSILRGSGGRGHRFRWVGLAALAVVGLPACTPADDWREVRIGEAGLRVRFPCRPERERRPWSPRAEPRPAELLSCRHERALYAVFSAELVGPDEVRSALVRLPAVTAARWQARVVEERETAPDGATPWPQARWQRLQGRAEGVGPVDVRTQVFGHGMSVHQVTVVTPEGAASPAADRFIAGIVFAR